MTSPRAATTLEVSGLLLLRADRLRAARARRRADIIAWLALVVIGALVLL